MLEEFLQTLWSPKFIEIFGIALLVQFATILAKYLTKLRVIGVSSTAGPDERRAAHFDCLRVGLDLSIVGIVSFFAIIQFVFSAVASQTAQPGVADLGGLPTVCGIVEFSLLLLAITFTGLYDSPRLSFWRGIFIPGIFGWLAICIAAGLLHYLRLKGLR
jgi:hypothetical protein